MPRVGFVTCVQLGLSCMEEVYASGGKLDFAITLRDEIAPRKSGRAAIDEFCGRHRVPLFKIRNINDADALEVFDAQRPDWLFVIGWSQIAREEVLSRVMRGVVGMHPTLLPVGRGRAAIPWAILKGLRETGVTAFQLDQGVDTGPILGQVRIPISEMDDAGSLYASVATAHRSLIRQIWPAIMAGELVGVPQDEHHATIWPGRTPADGEIRHDMTVDEVDRLVRATTRPYPGAFVSESSRRVRIWRGRPARVVPAKPDGAYLIELADGAYAATDFEFEPS